MLRRFKSSGMVFLGLAILVGFWGAWQIDSTAWQFYKKLQVIPLNIYPWIYQRSELMDSESAQFELVLVGDVLPGRNGRLQGRLGIPLELKNADLLIGNLEGAIADFNIDVSEERAPYLHAGEPEAALMLAAAGFDILSLANNHSLDLGAHGVQATIQHLEDSGIAWTGVGMNPFQASNPVFSQLGPTRVAILAANAVASPTNFQNDPGWNTASLDEGFIESLRSARQQADLVIVMVHWGYEYQRQVDPAQRRLAQNLLDAGADLVVGSHPHVAQEVEVIPSNERGRVQVIAYSLGDFIFDQGDLSKSEGIALRLVLDEKGIAGLQALPVQPGWQPDLIPLESGQSILNRISKPSSTIGFHCDAEGCSDASDPSLSARWLTGGIFWSGQSDLTGDGMKETVRRERQQVIVYQAGEEVWRTPESWRILDAALGDPDWDGRNEILLAMLKADEMGILRSHPFIMGYRGGIYRNLWGGSAVSDPIIEVELGNIDTSPEPELIVLEERDSGFNAVTVWDWHGWGFSLRWRSAEGNYSNLRLAEDTMGGPALIVVDKH